MRQVVNKKKREEAYKIAVVLDYYLQHGIVLVPEYKFSSSRDFRFDFANPDTKVALEVQGGVWKGSFGGHTSGAGYVRDIEKSNLAVANGWRIVQCVPQDVCMLDTVTTFKQTMEATKNG